MVILCINRCLDIDSNGVRVHVKCSVPLWLHALSNLLADTPKFFSFQKSTNPINNVFFQQVHFHQCLWYPLLLWMQLPGLEGRNGQCPYDLKGIWHHQGRYYQAIWNDLSQDGWYSRSHHWSNVQHGCWETCPLLDTVYCPDELLQYSASRLQPQAVSLERWEFPSHGNIQPSPGDRDLGSGQGENHCRNLEMAQQPLHQVFNHGATWTIQVYQGLQVWSLWSQPSTHPVDAPLQVNPWMHDKQLFSCYHSHLHLAHD